MNHRGQSIFAAAFLGLAVVLAGFHLQHKWPATTYLSAMAKGQFHRAGQLLEPQVAQHNPSALNALANQYYLGLGYDVQYSRALKLYHAAATVGYAAAQLNIGHLYNQGLGVKQNPARAFGWYMHADISGSPWAEYYMSQIAKELTLTPLQIATIKEQWRTLDALANEDL